MDKTRWREAQIFRDWAESEHDREDNKRAMERVDRVIAEIRTMEVETLRKEAEHKKIKEQG